MSRFEEQVLAYLDGSLSEAEREEMLHAASLAPEKRAMLDAHVRMRDLLAQTHKPVSAPLGVQRELARKVPLLAEKLPYLSEPVSDRKGAGFIGFWDRGASWVGALPTWQLNSILVVCGLLLLGSVGLLLRARHAILPTRLPSVLSVSDSASDVARSKGTAENRLPSNGGASSGLMPNGNNGDHVVSRTDADHAVSRTDADHAASQIDLNHAVSQADASHAVSEQSRATNSTDRRSQASVMHALDQDRASVSRQTSSLALNGGNSGLHRSGVHTGIAMKDLVQAPVSSSTREIHSPHPATTQTPRNVGPHGSVPGAVTSTEDIPGSSSGVASTNDARSGVTSISSIPLREDQPLKNTTVHSNSLIAIVEDENSHYVPVRFYAITRVRSLGLPSVPRSETLHQMGIGTDAARILSLEPGVGVDVELSPWLSATARAGRTHVGMMQSVTYAEPLKDYSYLTHVVHDVAVIDTAAYYAQAGVGYTISVTGAVEIATFLTAGAVFVNGVAPMGALEVAAHYRISAAMLVQGGLFYEALRANSLAGREEPLVPGSATVGEITRGIAARPLWESAYGISVGIVFHP